VALLITVTLLERLPAEVGANVTVKEADCPTARLSGNPAALVLKPAPLVLTCEMETLEFPVLVIVKLCVALVPVVKLPKLSDVGEAESWSVAAMPAPLNGTTSGEFGVLLMKVMLPGKLLAEAGANPTVKEVAPPGTTETGNANPEDVKPVPARGA